MTGRRSQREITEAVELCHDGALNPDAVGWSRRPLHSTHLPWNGRSKKWEYWGIMAGDYVIGLTIADLDYAHVDQIYIARLSDGREWTEDGLGAFSIKPPLSAAPPPFSVASGRLAMTYEPDGRALLSLDARHVQGEFVVEPGGEALGVVIAWSSKKFQYTLKDVARRVSGHLLLEGERIELDGWAVLDRGRGIWPYRKRWNWGAGSGDVNGTRLGLQVGGKWTAGTGYTENALFVDGRLHYIGEELTWTYRVDAPRGVWRVNGERIDATLTPQHQRIASVNVGVVAFKTYQLFGTWSGWAIDDDGQRHSLDGLVGWAEEATNRW